jgi:hypothetical protein
LSMHPVRVWSYDGAGTSMKAFVLQNVGVVKAAV